MNIRARFELSDLIAEWSTKYGLTPDEEIELVTKQLDILKEAALVVAMDGYSPEEK